MTMELTHLASKPGQESESHASAISPAKLSSTGLVLVPQPSDDVKDPLVCLKLSTQPSPASQVC